MGKEGGEWTALTVRRVLVWEWSLLRGTIISVGTVKSGLSMIIIPIN